ncbi:2-oxo acid dehydrogenase subunit E2 [Spiroplasma endosymbiont of Amphibalanus improvisus]|uniref:2-oxo acid dehydrogenase subunit E2 n=1 Tax=Spiroplasma endosymbiont of Amphibalanus improvisus TaxID=3066327 RepID=UPI00313C936C
MKVKASNLVGKGTLEKILVSDQSVKAGDELALVSTVNGKIVITSPYDGTITKLAMPGTKIKNGSVIASILNKNKTSDKHIPNDSVSSESFERMSSKWHEIKEKDFDDDFSGFAVKGSKYNVDPFNTTNIKNEKPISNKVLDENEIQPKRVVDTINRKNKEDNVLSTPFASKDIFQKMRNDIAKAVEKSSDDYEKETKILDKLKSAEYKLLQQNHNYNSKEKKSDIYIKSSTTKPSNAADIILGSFQSSDSINKSSDWKNLITNRKNKLHSENNFEKLELDSKNKIVNSIDDLDEDGRPKILRNLINKRLENFHIKNALDQHEPVGDETIGKKTRGYTLEDIKDQSVISNFKKNPVPFLEHQKEAEYIDANGNIVSSKNNTPKLGSNFSQPYFQVVKNLNAEKTREEIYGKRNLRHLIQERRKQISDGLIEDGGTIGSARVFERPSMSELEKQIQNPNYIPAYINGTNSDKFIDNSGNANNQFYSEAQTIQGSWKEKNNLLENVCTQIEEKVDRINSIAEYHPYSNVDFVQSYKRTGNIDFDLFEAEKYYFYLKDILNKNKHFEFGKRVSTAYSGRPSKNSEIVSNAPNMIEDVCALIEQFRTENKTDDSINKLIQVMTLKFLSENMLKKDPKVSTAVESVIDNVTEKLLTSNKISADDYTVKTIKSPYNKNTKYLNPDIKPDNKNLPEENMEFVEEPEWYQKLSSFSKKINPKNFTILRSRIDISFIMKLISSVNKLALKEHRFTTMTFIVKAISQALEFYPKLNGLYDSEKVASKIKHDHNIGIFSKYDEKYLIPVIGQVDKKTLLNIATDMNLKTQRMKKGDSFDEISKTRTLTIVNINETEYKNSDSFNHRYNLLTFFVDRVRKEVMKYKDKNVLKPTINLTLEVNRDIISINEATDFLNRVKYFLEHPQNLL